MFIKFAGVPKNSPMSEGKKGKKNVGNLYESGD